MTIEQPYRIMLVDDDPFLRNLLAHELEVKDYNVLIAENGLKAVTLLESQSVDIIITDLFMPDMDGIELINALRKHHPKLPIFAITGGSRSAQQGNYLNYAQRFGANEIFQKPVDMPLLHAKLEQYCTSGGK